MRTLKYIKTGLVVVISALVLTTSNLCEDKVTAQTTQTATVKVENSLQNISALTIVNTPKEFLGKTVTFNAKFDKFSTLGLDYKTALKSSEEYISFLIKREDTSYDIPLSEMKLFLKRDYAENFIELKTDDEIQVTGVVFSDALGDAWIDVSKLVLIKKAPEKDNGVK